jgi:hypothetical protein
MLTKAAHSQLLEVFSMLTAVLRLLQKIKISIASL